MDEFELIDRYFKRPGGSGVLLGIGDDGAVVEVPPGRQLVCVVDTLVDGVHFPPDFDAADVGYRAVAVNLSDIAAMGATPAWMTLALTLPRADPDWLEPFAAGLHAAAGEHGVTLIGGDTTRGPQTVISVQLLGHVAPGACLRRDGCRHGDRVYVSGTPGDAAAGLAQLQAGEPESALTERFRRPQARVALGQAVAGLASAAIDISDGLFADLERLLRASGVGATIERDALPLSPELRAAAGDARAAGYALTGGDDYELCLTAPVAAEQQLQAAASRCGVPLTCIGSVDDAPGLRVTAGGSPLAMQHAGYRHF